MNDYYEYIDDYIAGLLKGDQLIAFEDEVTRNPSLKLAVENHDAAKKISKGLLELDMLATLNDLKANHSSNQYEQTTIQNSQNNKNIDRSTSKMNQEESKINRSSNTSNKTKATLFSIRNFMAAASIIGILFFTGWWMTRSTYANIDTKKILAIYEKPYDKNSTKSAVLKDQSSFEMGKSQFSLRDYEASEKYLKIALSETSDEILLSQIHEWLGAAHMYQGEIEESISSLEKSNEKLALKNLKTINSYLDKQ